MSFKKKGDLRGFRFAFDLSSDQAPEDSTPEENYKKEIPIFREGIFEHPWYGKLVFDRDFLNSIVDNHNKSVVPQQISFDRDHKPGEGALAWVEEKGVSLREVMIEGQPMAVLFAKIEYTPEGYEEIVVKKKFKYFSSEIHGDYTNYELKTIAEGEQQMLFYGPTLVGGGFTNRPFIPHLGSVFSTNLEGKQEEHPLVMVMSEKTEESAVYGMISGVAYSDNTNTPEPTQEEVQEEGETYMKLSELIALAKQFSGSQKREFIFSKLNELSEDEQAVAQLLVENEQKIELSEKVAQEQTRKAELAAAEVAKQKNQIVELSTKVLEAKQQTYASRVNAFSEKLKADNFAPAVADEVKNVLLGLNSDGQEFKFSVDGSEKQVDMVEILERIFSKMPEDLRVPTAATFSNESQNVEDKQEQAKEQAPTAPDKTERELRIEKYTQQFGMPPAEDIIELLNERGVPVLPIKNA